jgi:hypothetical protein
MNDQQQTPSEQITVRGSFNFLYLLLSGHVTCLTPFLHVGFGSEALGINGLAALVVILLYATYTGSTVMVNFLYVWLFMMLVQRIKTGSMRRQGHVIHSRYDGFPHLATRFVKSEQAARVLEAFMCGVIGILLMSYDEALGAFIAIGFLSMMFKLAIERRIDEVSVQRMRDAEIEQRWLVEQNKTRR